MTQAGFDPQTEPVSGEMRIALAFSGAISLVLYECGVAHEVYEFAAMAAKTSYYNDAHMRAGIDPVVDILTGASAGGINSILLASCLRTGQAFSRFRRPWIAKADVRVMRWGSARPLSLLNPAPLVEAMRPMLCPTDAGQDCLTQADDLRVRLCRTRLTPFGLTTQDAIGHSINEETRSNTIGFAGQAFDSPNNVEPLLSAACATSAFPLAFPPVKQSDGESARYYIDGGLWDNQPLDLAVQLVLDKPAFRRTHRYVFFIDPDPTDDATASPRADEPPPGLLNVLAGVPFMGLKGAIWPSITQILDANQRLQILSMTASTNEAAQFKASLGETQLRQARNETLAASMGPCSIAQPRSVLNEVRTAETLLGGDAALVQRWNRLQQVVAARAPADLPTDAMWHAAIRGLHCLEETDLRREAARRMLQELNTKIISEPGRYSGPSIALQKASLYESIERCNNRLLVVHPADGTGANDPFKRVSLFRQPAEDMLCSFEILVADRNQPILAEPVVALLNTWVNDVNAKYTHAAGLHGSTVVSRLASHSRAFRVAGSVAASGLPHTTVEATAEDAGSLILSAISSLIGKCAIDLVRIGPTDTNNLHLVEPPPASKAAKLAGRGLGHFQGFFNEKWRRNDYAWGRLDAAELLLRAYQRAAASQGRPVDETVYREWLDAARTSILDQEKADAQLDEAAPNGQLIGYGGRGMGSLPLGQRCAIFATLLVDVGALIVSEVAHSVWVHLRPRKRG